MAKLNVTRKTIQDLFSKMQKKKFIIPDYQRPYAWDKEKCETLWLDIENFFNESNSEKENKKEYFLGTIVTCKDNSDHEIEVIDGQQRITSLFLLLRAFYSKLEGMDEDKNISGLKRQIAPCLWDVDSISQEVTDSKKIHIESKVATQEKNDILHQILYSGKTEKIEPKDPYASNYKYFLDKCDEYAKKAPPQWQPLIVTILTKCIILPIECENLETALTIFSTLNDRGMPLSDSDIFKAKIYKSKDTKNEKDNFANSWKDLSEKAESAKIPLNDLFRYYSHILRAKEGNSDKEIGLRKFYTGEKQKARLHEEGLMEDLLDLCEFWSAIRSNESEVDLEGGTLQINDESKKYLQCLDHYPNEFWKYFVSVFFHSNKSDKKFSEKFSEVLKKITAFLLFKFIERPTVNEIKTPIYKACIYAWEGKSLRLDTNFKFFKKESISHASSYRVARSLILLHAYLNENQEELIPTKFDIEHIFPHKWQNTNYNGWTREDADEYLEKFGNKATIEKKLNIQAGNNYFGKKKEKYTKSKIADIKELSKRLSDDWVKEDIEKREESFASKIYDFFKENLS